MPQKNFLTIIIFIFWFVIFAWFVTKVNFFNQSGLSKKWLVGLFVIKVFSGLAYGLFFMQPAYYATSDTWHFFDLSKGETDWLLKDPVSFVKDIFSYGYQQSGNLFLGQNSYWNDLKSNIIIKLMAVCNLFTFKNYYANIIFFNFLFFFGPVALYRILKDGAGNKTVLILSVFCIPSFLFWCSGVHKDGLLFSFFSLLMFYCNLLIKQKRFSWQPFLISGFSFLMIFFLRNFMALLILPALVTWLLCEKYPSKKILNISCVYGVCLVLFFISPYISENTNFLQYVVDKQNEFKQLKGGSEILVPELYPTLHSFLEFSPTALDIAFLRPHINEMHNLSYAPAIVETVLLWLITLICFIKRKKFPADYKGIIIFCLCFSISVLLLAGYTNVFSGAIVRYRSLELPFLFAPLALLSNKKILRF